MIHRPAASQTGLRSVIHALLLLSLLLVGLIPAGFMPDFQAKAGSFFPITICHGVDTATIWLDDHGNPGDPAKNKAPRQSHEICTFASLHGYSPALSPILAGISLAWVAMAPRPAAPERVMAGNTVAIAQPRGPPLPF